ncbi:hypothetical protein DV735_g4655, partial [Chaetothyriales sp. CBS 134920]
MVRGSIDDDAADSSRRLSARSRKLTAKAQALSGSRFLPSDSANIPFSTKSTDSLPTSPSPGDSGSDAKTSVTSTDQLRSSARARSTSSMDLDELGTVTPKVGIDEAAINKSPQRPSKRERKLPAKLLETAGPAKVATARKRKRSTPPSPEEPRYKMRQRRSTAAMAQDTELVEASDDHLDETVNKRHSRKSTNALDTAPSHSRHMVTSEEHNAPQISDTPTSRSKRRMTRADEDGMDALKRGRPEKTAAAPGHSEHSLEARPSSTLKASSQPLRKHPKQHTKGQRRAGSAPAASSTTRSQIADSQDSNSDRLKNVRPPKRRKVEGEETGATDLFTPKRRKVESEETGATDLSTPKMPRQSSRLDKTLAKETTTGSQARGPEIPNSQTRLILTMPLPASTTKSGSGFPAQVRKAEFVDKGCQLFCLDASSRILAFAEIAAELPESDEGEAEDSSWYEKWLELGRSRFCVCGKPDTSGLRSDLTEEELARILEPDGMAQVESNDSGHGPLATSPSMSLPRVNTIVKASEGLRVSALYNQVIAGSTHSRQTITRPPSSLATRTRPSSALRRGQLKGPRKSYGIFGSGLDSDGLRKSHKLLERTLIEGDLDDLEKMISTTYCIDIDLPGLDNTQDLGLRRIGSIPQSMSLLLNTKNRIFVRASKVKKISKVSEEGSTSSSRSVSTPSSSKTNTASKRTPTVAVKKSPANDDNSAKQIGSAATTAASSSSLPLTAQAEEKSWSTILEQARAFATTSRSISQQVHDLVESRRDGLERGTGGGDEGGKSTGAAQDAPAPPTPVVDPTTGQATARRRGPLRPSEMPYEQLVKMSEYRQKQRQWTGFIVAAPIAIVLSYELWRRWQAESERRVEEAKRITSGG